MPDAVTDPRERISAVANHLSMSKTCARLLLRLYDAGGKPVHRELLMDEIAALSRDVLKSNVYQMRQAVGDGIIGVQRGSSGLGYSLTPRGLSLVLCALNPPELTRVIGEWQ